MVGVILIVGVTLGVLDGVTLGVTEAVAVTDGVTDCVAVGVGVGDGGIYVYPLVQLLTLLNINCGPETAVVNPTPLFRLVLDNTSVKVCPLTVISSKYESASLNGLCTRKPERVPARFPAISL